MFSQKLLPKKRIFNLKRCLHKTKITEIQQPLTCLGPLLTKQPERDSILHALLQETLNAKDLSYPEQTSDRHKNFVNWLKPIQTYVSSCANTSRASNKEEILSHLRELEVFRTHINDENLGLELLNMESLRLIEVLSTIPWLGAYFVNNHKLPVQLISKYGSKNQMHKYFGKIISGEIIPTICITDRGSRTNINDIETHMVLNGDSWILNGKKTFVANGINSNLFLVFARYGTSSFTIRPDSFSLLLVEKNFGGVTCQDVYDTIGRHEMPVCTIDFQDTVVPKENVIGEPGKALEILLEALKPGQRSTSAQAISILRNFINHLIKDVLKLKHFDRDLYNFDVVKNIIGDMTMSLYTMESMTYLTHGMIDLYEDMNAEMEEIITDMYCANKCLSCIQAGLQLIGSPSYMNNELYIQALHDAIALTAMDINNLDANIFVAMRVVQVYGGISSTHVRKLRKNLKHPFYSIMSIMFTRLPESTISSVGGLHPSLEPAVKNLEASLSEFRESVLKLLTDHGSEIPEKYSDLYRISEMIVHIYAGVANMLRASRSYNIGVRNADIERIMALNTSYLTRIKISEMAAYINHGPMYNGDVCYKNTMDLMYEKRAYAIEHPVSRTY